MLTAKLKKMKKHIINITAILFTILTILTSCNEDTIEPWIGQNYIQFQKDYNNFYSFVYAGSDVEKDTITLRLNIAGNMAPTDRTFKIKQVKSYGFIYEKDDFGNILDSAFIELPNQALPDVHYQDISNKNFIVPADSLGAYFNVVVLRDETLKSTDYTLSFEVQESKDFLPGNASLQKVTLTLSDQIEEPSLWYEQVIGNTALFSVMAYYGKVKHQLLIDVTGQTWDDNFIANDLTEEYLVFYKNLAVQELNRINDERQAQGLHKLREDDSNPNSEIYFF